MVPSRSGNTASGWSNDPCTVTSHKMIEKEIGYRGSKSLFLTGIPIIKNSVKEQRVDGSWFKNLNLRCTLMGFERNYQVKILSKQLNKNEKLFSSIANNSKLNPWFIMGFSDAESSFNLSIYKDEKMKLGWHIKPHFEISLHVKDLPLLLQLKEFFCCGEIYINNTRCAAVYVISSLQDLTTILIPHFEKYNLISQKAANFMLFKEAINLMNNKEHLSFEGLTKIINIKASMNLGLSDLLKFEFPNYKLVARTIIETTNIPDPNWIAGFSSGEACFFVNIPKSKTKIGYRAELTLSIGQHKRDKNLLELIAKYLSCGKVYCRREDLYDFRVTKISDIQKIIIPMFQSAKIQGVKQLDFQDFCEVANLMSEKKHLTIEGLEFIRSIKSRMNRSREFF